MKKIEAVLHYYKGAKYRYKNEFGTYSGIVGDYHTERNSEYASFKLILRPITSLTDDEKVKWYGVINNMPITENFVEGDRRWALGVINGTIKQFDQTAHLCAKSFHYLLSIGIDLFNLIETNQALNRTNQ